MKSKWFKLCLVPAIILISCIKQEVDPGDQQLANEVTAINNYIAANYQSAYTLTFQSGIGMVLLHFGNGTSPHTGQKVKISYSARVFSDSTYFENTVVEDVLENIGPSGLQTTIANMTEGSSATVFIPSKYAFGTTGATNVPANATVVYDVYLVSITKTSAEQAQFNIDTAAIHQYLINDTIKNAVLHPTGIWYTIDIVGTGSSPKVYDYVNASFKGTVMSNGSIIQNGNIPSQNIFGLIDGLKIGVPLMSEGGKATFYIPSSLAYGTDSSISVGMHSNSNLIYTVQLNSVLK